MEKWWFFLSLSRFRICSSSPLFTVYFPFLSFLQITSRIWTKYSTYFSLLCDNWDLCQKISVIFLYSSFILAVWVNWIFHFFNFFLPRKKEEESYKRLSCFLQAFHISAFQYDSLSPSLSLFLNVSAMVYCTCSNSVAIIHASTLNTRFFEFHLICFALLCINILLLFMLCQHISAQCFVYKI